MLHAYELKTVEGNLRALFYAYEGFPVEQERLEIYLKAINSLANFIDLRTLKEYLDSVPAHFLKKAPTPGEMLEGLKTLQARKNKDAETAQILGRNPTADYQAISGNTLSTPALSGNAPKTAQDAPESEIPAWVADWVGGTVDYSQGRYREEYICEFVGFEKDLRRAVPMDVPSLWHKIATTKIMFAYNAGRTMGKVAQKRMIQGFEDSLADSGPAAQKMFASLVEAAQVS
jgi:hypothetical protein